MIKKIVIGSLIFLPAFITLNAQVLKNEKKSKVVKQDLKLEIDYFPKQMAWTIDKKDLGVVITQKMIFKGGASDRRLVLTPLEYLYDKNGATRPKEALYSTEKNKNSLVPFILENSEILVPKGKNVDYNLKVQTNKEMSGCYFFSFYPRLISEKGSKRENNKKEETSEGVKSAVNFNLTMLSGGFLHIKGTEVYEVKDTVEIKKSKDSQLITYKFDFEGNCILRMVKFKVDILQGNRVVLSQNKLQSSIKDRSYLPGMSAELPISTKLPLGEYRIRVMMYSDDDNFKDFFHIKEESFKI